MAHFLSQVTLSKLDARRELVPPTEGVAGIQNIRDVPGFFRCVTAAWMVRERPNASANRGGDTPRRGLSPQPSFGTPRAGGGGGSGTFDATDGASGLVPNASFAGSVASAPVDASARSRMSKTAVMWCGEQDGNISVRSFTTGETMLTIEAKPKTFVFALLDVCAGVVWAGLSDGFIRVFDTFSQKLVDEVRGHCGAITAMALASMPTTGSIPAGADFSVPQPPPSDSTRSVVITASNDWTIALWDVAAVHSANDPLRRTSSLCICRLNAHQNAVRSLAVDLRSGSHIFASGADDGSIRVWDLAKLAAEDDTLAPNNADRTRPTSAGHRSAFRTATACAAAGFGAWPVERAHKGQVSQIVFCGDSEAEVDTVRRRFGEANSSPGAGGGLSHRHRNDLVTSAYDNRTQAARAAAARLMAQEPRHNKFLVSAGHDGAVRVWDKGSGAMVHEVEVRPCPVTSLLLDPIHARLWIGGVDSVITVYDENTLEHLATLHDHSGSYVVDFHAIRGVAAVDAWALDANGDLYQTKFGSRSGAMDTSNANEEAQFALIHGLRATVIANFEALQDLRSETDYLSNIDDHRKRALARVLGDNTALTQRYLVAVTQWRYTHRARTGAAFLSHWMYTLSTNATMRHWYLLWRRFARTHRHNKVVSMLSDGLNQSRDAALRRRYVLLLHKAAEHKEKFMRLQRTAGLVFSNNNRAVMQMNYYRWVRFASMRRELKAREVVASIMLRSSDGALLQEYWRRLVDCANLTEARRKREFVLRLFTRGSGMGLLEAYFRKWSDARPYLKAARIERMSMDVLFESRNRHIRQTYYDKWMSALSLLKARHADEEEARIKREHAEWQRLFETSSHLTRDSLAERRAALDERKGRLREQHAMRAQQILDDQEEVNRLLRRKYMTSANLDPNAPVETQCKQLMDLLKARGVNCGYDIPVIEKARGHLAVLERGEQITGEPPVGLVSAPSSAAASRQGTSSARATPTTTPRPATAGGGRAGSPLNRTPSNATLNRSPSSAGMQRSTSGVGLNRNASSAGLNRTPSSTAFGRLGSGGSASSPARSQKPTVDAGFQRALRMAKQKLFDLSIHAGYRHVPPTAIVTGEAPAEDLEPDSGARQEWGVPTTVLTQNLKPRDRRDLAFAVKELVVAYDYASNTILASKLGSSPSPASPPKAGSKSPPRLSSGSRPQQPAGPRFRSELLKEFVLNSHLFLMLVQHEYERAVKVGATAGDDYKDDKAAAAKEAATTGRRRGVSLTRSGAPTLPPKRAASQGVTKTPSGTGTGADGAETASSAAETATSAGGKPLTRSEQLKQEQLKRKMDAQKRIDQIGERNQKKAQATTQASLNKKAKDDPTRMRPYMGFRVEPFTAGKAGAALRVAKVADGSPAEDSDIQVGDVVLRFANLRVTDLAGFNATVSRHATIGKAVPVTLQRNGEKLDKAVTVAGRFPDAAPSPQP